MKVFVVVYRDSERAGGSVRVAEVLARSLLAKGIDFQVIVAYGAGGRLERLLGEKCILLNASGPRDLLAWARYRRLIASQSPDIVHYVDNVGWMILAGAWAGAKRINHQHFRPDVGPDGHRRFRGIRWLLGTADRIIAISFGAKRVLIEGCGVTREKIVVVHNAVDANYLCPRQSGVCSGPSYTLGMAIRVVEDKGIEDAFNLLKILPDNFQLAIAGDGPARIRLERLALDMGLEGRVVWKGSLQDVSVFYSEIDFYLFMSWYEGFGLSVAEAMYSGVPVVGLLGDGEIAEPEYPLVTEHNSIVVQRSNPGFFGVEQNHDLLVLLAERIVGLAEDEACRDQMVMAAKDWVISRFSSSIFAERVVGVYKGLLPEARPDLAGG